MYNMDIAIKFEKFDLGEDKYVFKPICVIKGKYDEETDSFETDYGQICAPIDGDCSYDQDFFGALTTIEELKEEFDFDNETDILAEYFESWSSFYTLGFFDYVNNKTQILSMPCEEIEKVFTMAVNKDEVEDENETVANKEQNTIEDSEKQRVQLKYVLTKQPIKPITLAELRKEVKDVIKGQDKAVDDITRGIIVNQRSKNPKHKSHMLIMGPSGTGKTEMVNIIAKKMGIPFFKADATAYTKEGYVGKSVYSMFYGLIASADGNIEKAQNGILIIDEIDKKLSSRKDDVGGTDVLNSLLKIMDRDVIELEKENTLGSKSILFDTSNLTIIFMGAFADIYAEKEKSKKKTIGFGNPIETEKEPTKTIVTNEDLIKAGMPPEFLGRIPIITNTDELTLENLVEILHKSKGGTIDEEKEFCRDLGITLKVTKGFMEEIAKKAHAAKTGARNLRKDVRASLSVAYDEILSGKDIKVLKLTKATANDNKKYYTE